jgi:integrase
MVKLELQKTSIEGLLQGVKSDGKKYSVRENRMGYFMPDDWLRFFNTLKSKKAKLTADVLIQTGCRINEARFLEERDVDYNRNTLTLRITKCKAKKGEKVGKPRTIPISSQFSRRLHKHFSNLTPGEVKIGILSTPAFNIAMKNALKRMGYKDWHSLSAHNIRKTHGFWLKVLGNLNIMDIDASEICLRLGHDYNTYLKSYGSPGVLNNKDIVIIQNVLGDLYSRRRGL